MLASLPLPNAVFLYALVIVCVGACLWIVHRYIRTPAPPINPPKVLSISERLELEAKLRGPSNDKEGA